MAAIVAKSFLYINQPSVFMREKPNANSKVVSEAYYSEEVAVVAKPKNKNAKWLQIQTVVDGYKGWVPKNSFVKLKTAYPGDQLESVLKVNRTRVHIYSVNDTEYGPKMELPYGCKLKIIKERDEANKRWIEIELLDGKKAFIQRGDCTINPQKIPLDQIVEFSKQFLGLPYSWGGRGFAFDCSGLCQRLYREMGYDIPRDSKDQYAWSGFQAADVSETQAGDLVFFGTAADKIRHVGMCIGNNQFIHSTVQELKPYIRISSLDDPNWSGAGDWKFRAARRLK